MSTPLLARTPLHAWHVAHGARLVESAGWLVPISYGAADDEAARADFALADMTGSPLGVDVPPGQAAILLLGTRVEDVLRRLTSFDVGRAAFPPGASAETGVAGVAARLTRLPEGMLLRVGGDVAEYVWERLLDAGRAWGAAAVGRGALRLPEGKFNDRS